MTSINISSIDGCMGIRQQLCREAYSVVYALSALPRKGGRLSSSEEVSSIGNVIKAKES
jgi:hypothetical protein